MKSSTGILESELAGVVCHTHYSFLVFGFGRIPIVAWLRQQADASPVHAQQAGEVDKMLRRPGATIAPPDRGAAPKWLDTKFATNATSKAEYAPVKLGICWAPEVLASLPHALANVLESVIPSQRRCAATFTSSHGSGI